MKRLLQRLFCWHKLEPTTDWDMRCIKCGWIERHTPIGYFWVDGK